MKKDLTKISSLLLIFFLFFSSCTEDPSTEIKDTVYKKDILNYMEKLKALANDERSERIDNVADALDFTSVTHYKQKGNEDFLIGNITDLESFKSDGILKVIFFLNDGEIVRSNLIDFNNKNVAHDKVIASIFNADFNPKSYSGKISVYSIFQDIVFFNVIENGDLKVYGNINGQRGKAGDGSRTKGCIDWYLITTYTYSNGSKRTTEEYVTTCGDECNETRIGGRTKCGGSGGTTVGNGGPVFPNNPINGDRYDSGIRMGRWSTTSMFPKGISGLLL